MFIPFGKFLNILIVFILSAVLQGLLQKFKLPVMS